MRAVNKGENPGVKYIKYQDAEPDLKKRIGAYCSYCEYPIKHVPEVEHKVSKSEGGELLKWENLLLSCKYCNTRKSNQIKPYNKGEYLWPDEDDTFHAYSYKNLLPELNDEYLKEQSAEVQNKAKNLFELVGLGHKPVIGEKDRRFFERNEARNNAMKSKEGWAVFKKCDDECRKMYLNTIILLAQCGGFFSTWMEIFNDEEEVREALIKAFPGTREDIIHK